MHALKADKANRRFETLQKLTHLNLGAVMRPDMRTVGIPNSRA